MIAVLGAASIEGSKVDTLLELISSISEVAISTENSIVKIDNVDNTMGKVLVKDLTKDVIERIGDLQQKIIFEMFWDAVNPSSGNTEMISTSSYLQNTYDTASQTVKFSKHKELRLKDIMIKVKSELLSKEYSKLLTRKHGKSNHDSDDIDDSDDDDDGDDSTYYPCLGFEHYVFFAIACKLRIQLQESFHLVMNHFENKLLNKFNSITFKYDNKKVNMELTKDDISMEDGRGDKYFENKSSDARTNRRRGKNDDDGNDDNKSDSDSSDSDSDEDSDSASSSDIVIDIADDDRKTFIIIR